MKKAIYKDYVTTTEANWTAKQFCEYADQGLVKFDNAVQRGYVWNLKQKSLLIHSLIVNYLPPEFLANKVGGIYDMIDGKQRYDAISSFLKNKYKLSDVPDIVSESGSSYVLNGQCFNDLDEEIRDKITGRLLKLSVIDNASQEVIKEFFYRRNNGTVLTAARKTFSMAKSFDEIAKMAQHPIFNVMLRGEKNDEANGIVMKSYVLLFCDNRSLENKKVFAYVKKAQFAQAGIDEIMAAYDTLLAAHDILGSQKTKVNIKVMSRMMTKTHMVTLVYLAKYVNDHKIDLNVFAAWLQHFFDGAPGATVSEEYNKNATTGSSKVGAVEGRLRAMMENFAIYTGL